MYDPPGRFEDNKDIAKSDSPYGAPYGPSVLWWVPLTYVGDLLASLRPIRVDHTKFFLSGNQTYNNVGPD